MLDKTNEYADWIHQHIGGSKVVTMAPYNSLDSETYPTWDGKTNRDVLKELILYTVADIAGVHLYNDGYTDQLNLVRLAKDINEWNDEAAYEKQIWITECGAEPRDQHVNYYKQMVRLMRNTINPQKIIWYRQCSTKAGDHTKFSLEYTDGTDKSPLYDLLLDE